MFGPRIVLFEAVISLSCSLLFLLFYVLLLCLSIDFGPWIVVFEAVIMLSCCLLLFFKLFFMFSLR